VPLYIGPMGTGYYTVSSKARIKAIAHNKNNFMVNDWDMTDEDFCPPIDYELLTPEERDYLMSLGNLSMEGGGVVEEVIESVDNFVEEIIGPIAPIETPIETPVEEPIIEEPASPDASQGGPVTEETVEEPASPDASQGGPISTDPIEILEELIAEPVILIEEPISDEQISNESISDESITSELINSEPIINEPITE